MGDLLGETTLDWALNTIHLATTATLRQSPPPMGGGPVSSPPTWVVGIPGPARSATFFIAPLPNGGGWENRPPGG